MVEGYQENIFCAHEEVCKTEAEGKDNVTARGAAVALTGFCPEVAVSITLVRNTEDMLLNFRHEWATFCLSLGKFETAGAGGKKRDCRKRRWRGEFMPEAIQKSSSLCAEALSRISLYFLFAIFWSRFHPLMSKVEIFMRDGTRRHTWERKADSSWTPKRSYAVKNLSVAEELLVGFTLSNLTSLSGDYELERELR